MTQFVPRITIKSGVLLWMILAVLPAIAEDRFLTKQEIENKFVGKLIGYTAGNGDRARLKSNGKYELLLYGGYTARGTYTVGEGEICIELPTISYCEKLLESDGLYYLIDRNGKRENIEIVD